MTSMIKKIAKAICEAANPSVAYEDQGELSQQLWLKLSDAALTALEQPTEEMLTAGFPHMPDYSPDTGDVARVFTAMIKAAKDHPHD